MGSSTQETSALQYLLQDRALVLSVNSYKAFNPLNQTIFEILKKYYSQFKEAPTKETLVNEVRKLVESKRVSSSEIPYISKVLSQLFSKFENKDYRRSEAVRFLKKAICKEALRRSIDEVDNENYDRIYKAITETKNFGQDDSTDEIVYAKATRDYTKEKKIPTGIEKLDDNLNGGIGIKELTVILGLPKAGKSISLLNLAASAILTACKVAFITLEFSARKTLRRFDARFSGIPYRDVPSSQDLLKERLKAVREEYQGSLILKEFPPRTMTASMLEAQLDLLEQRHNFVPDVVIVDYADIMKAEVPNKVRRFEYADIYENLRKIAVERNCAVATASQSNRLGFGKKVLTMQEFSEDFSKAFTADVILSICASKAETERNLMRYYIAGTREAGSGREILVRTDWTRALIADL